MNYLLNPCTDPHRNMALDECILERMRGNVFCLWRNAPSVIIGQNQSAYAEVNLPYLREKGIVLARRVTGGGAVYHDLANLNYTIAGDLQDPGQDAAACLEQVAGALRSLGVPAEITGRNDITVEGRKCSGFAKRLWKNRFLIHGTLMFDVDIAEMTRALAVPGSKLAAAGIESVRSRVGNLKDCLPFSSVEEFRDALQERLAGGDGEVVLSPEDEAAVEALADGKFRTWEWIYGHSPETAFQVKRRFSCGSVEARFDLRHGRIDTLRFGGDFIGNLSLEPLEKALQGCPFTAEELAERMEKEPVGQYFDRLSPLDLVSLLTGGE